MTSRQKTKNAPLRQLAWLPIPFFLVAMVVLRAIPLKIEWDSPTLVMVLNFLTRTLACLLIMYLAGKSFLVGGETGLLLLGCGVAIWGGSGFIESSSFALNREANFGVVVSNVGIWLAALCHLSGVILSRWSKRTIRPTGIWLGAGYILALGAVGLIILATLEGWLPFFFTDGQGGTLVRYIVLGSALAMFGLTAVLLWEENHLSLSSFHYWYTLALMLIAVGVFGMIVQLSRASLLNWTCRTVQYLSGIYMVIAAIEFRRESGGIEITLAQVMNEPRYRYGVAITVVIAAIALRLTILPVLGTRVAFLTFYPAVMVAALYGGLWTGLLATVLSVLAATYFLIEPTSQFSISQPADWLVMVVFSLSCIMISFITEAMHRARASLVSYQKNLEEMVKARTKELEREITERKRAEEVLQESKERYHTLFTNMNEAFLLVEMLFDNSGTPYDYRMLEVNKAYERMTGLKAADVVGKTALDIFSNYEKSWIEIFGKVAMTKEEIRFERHSPKNDRYYEVLSYSPIKDKVAILLVDITKRKQAEEALCESERRYSALFSNKINGMAHCRIITDEQGRPVDYWILQINEAYERIIGIKKADIEGHRVTEVFPDIKNYAFNYIGIYGKIALEGGEIEFEEFFEATRQYLSIYAYSPLPGEFTAIFTDVSDRIQAEKALRQSEDQYRTLFNTMLEGFCIIEVLFDKDNRPIDYRFLVINPAFEGQTGLRNAQGKLMRQLAPEHEEYWFEIYGKVALTGESARFVNEAKALNRWYDVSAYRVGGQDSRKVAILFNDITECKRAEEDRLASEREFLKVTLNSLGEGVVAVDQEERIILINEAASNLTGYSQEEVIGEPISKILYILDDQTSEPIDKLSYQAVVNQPVLVTRDLHEVVIAIHSAPILATNGTILGTVIVFADITEKQKTDQELLKAAKLDSLGILAGGVAHDFNNILAGILANLQLATIKLKKREDISKYLESTIAISRKASNLTKQLLTFAKGGDPVKKSASIAKLVKETVQFALSGSKLKAEFHLPEDLWVVDIDEGQITQVVNNLTINADQAMTIGGVLEINGENVTFEDTGKYQLGQYIKLTFKDHGIGISEEIISKIFDPFFTTKKTGNGLGLSTSYSIIKKHNGYLEVESSPGIGTVFTILLPASIRELTIKETQKELAAGGEAKILLMDDEDAIRNVGGEMLAYFGYQVTLARDGQEAVELYKQAREVGEPFDVVIMDLTIPGGLGGIETMAILRRIDPGVKAIISSGYASDPVMADYERYGFSGVVTKPYKFDELTEVLNKVIDRKQLPLEFAY